MRQVSCQTVSFDRYGSSDYDLGYAKAQSGMNQGCLFGFCCYFIVRDKAFGARENPLRNKGGFPERSIFEEN